MPMFCAHFLFLWFFLLPIKERLMFSLFPCFTSYYRGGKHVYADNAYVGLALPGETGSWEKESKVYLELVSPKLILSWVWIWCYWQGYQFWTQADTKGFFLINNIVPGDYNLYAWVPGFIGDYRYNVTINIKKGRIFFPNFLVASGQN